MYKGNRKVPGKVGIWAKHIFGVIMDKYMLQCFETYYPSYKERSVSVLQRSPTELEIHLIDGTTLIYDDLTNGLYTENNNGSEENQRTQEDWHKEFVLRLTRSLRRKGYTQKMLAEQLNVSQPTVSSWMSGRALPRVDDAVKIAHILKVPIVDLIDFW